tara:strand:- start:296 stop:445 length:150 start_codon:yes stop_codon:yes gene_type:complete
MRLSFTFDVSREETSNASPTTTLVADEETLRWPLTLVVGSVDKATVNGD